MNPSSLRAQPGFALAVTLILIIGVSVLAAGAMLMGANSTLVRTYNAQHDALASAADAGLEIVRARINAEPNLYPDSGYVALETNVPVTDATGQLIPGATRSTYVGPVGITSGEYGVFGAIVSVVRSGPNLVVRRLNIVQESFAKYAYFTDIEPSNIAFGSGDQIYGPVHSNDTIRIYASGATFHGHVTTANTIVGRQHGTFRDGYTENASPIPLPQLADVEKLRVQGTAGNTAFTTSSNNPVGRARMRIEFVALDLNNNGDVRGENEGFIRVYTSNDTAWVVGSNPVDSLRNSRNCGHVHSNGQFYSAWEHGNVAGVTDDVMTALASASRRCYLGGAPEIFNGFTPVDFRGQWVMWPDTPSALLGTRPDRRYLFPITRQLNPSFKGVIFVDGDVAISGVLRGRVTVAATGNIVIADDITYATDPSVGTCEDILGLFAGGNVVIANTPVNAPWKRRAGSSQAWYSYDDSTDEFVHGFVLTLNQFFVQDFSGGATNHEKCQTTNWGRGCLYLTGGIIQRQRGPVGTTSGTGYLKRYSYDTCGVTAPPPYFPTTGRFAASAYYDVDPTGFDIASYFNVLTAGS